MLQIIHLSLTRHTDLPPKQGCVLHIRVCDCTKLEQAGLKHGRRLIWVPPPQVFVHFVHSAHCAQTPFCKEMHQKHDKVSIVPYFI